MLSHGLLSRCLLLCYCCIIVPVPSSSFSQHKQLNIAFVTGNAMKANEMNTILANHGATKNSEGTMVNTVIA
jgi:hypothetical protein